MSFKILHQFNITIDQEVEEISTKTENGQEITVKSKVVKPVEHTIVLKEPTRRERQELTLFQGVAYNKAIDMGLLPQLVMTQKISRDSATVSGDDDKNLAAMNVKVQELANDYIRLNAQSGETEDLRGRKEQLLAEWMSLQKKVIDINTAYQSVFAHTAERYAQNRVLLWLSLFLTYIKKGDKNEPLFAGADFKAKEERLGELEDSDDKIYFAALDKLTTCWMLYYGGRASKPEDFIKVEEEWKRQLENQKKAQEAAEKEKAKANDSPAPADESKATITPDQAPAS